MKYDKIWKHTKFLQARVTNKFQETSALVELHFHEKQTIYSISISSKPIYYILLRLFTRTVSKNLKVFFRFHREYVQRRQGQLAREAHVAQIQIPPRISAT
jgi:hypothetical protein